MLHIFYDRLQHFRNSAQVAVIGRILRVFNFVATVYIERNKVRRRSI